MTRRKPTTPRGLLATLALLGLALGASGCDEVTTSEPASGLVVYDAGPGGGPDGGIRKTRPVARGEIAPVYGFVDQSARVEYYYLGEVDKAGPKVPVNPIYFFYDENGKPLFRLSRDGQKLVGWHPIVNVVPTKTGYSPYWRVYRVTVKGSIDAARIDALAKVVPPRENCQQDAVCEGGKRCIEERCTEPIKIGDFPLDGIKSLDTLNDSKLEIKQTDQVINCPMVEADAKLLKGISNPDLPFPKVKVWFERLAAFCYLVQGGKDLLGRGTGNVTLAKDGQPAIADAYFLRQKLAFGTQTSKLVLPARNLVLTQALPGQSGYATLVREINVIVGKDHEFKEIRSVEDILKAKLPLERTGKLHNLVVRGTIPKCSSDDDCAGTGGTVDPPLKCSVEQGYCSPPFARFGEECRRGVKECDPRGGPGGTRLACVGLRVRDKFFCFNACDSSKPDENPDPDIDTRCGSAANTRCFALRRTDPARPNGVCIRTCNSRAGNQKALLKECELPKCGDGKLDYGETCDDGNTKSGDGCNQYCSLSTFDRCDNQSDCKGANQKCEEPVFGHGTTYCTPPATKEKDEDEENGKFRTICMEFDYCWPPDDRADWLGKKDDAQGGTQP